MEDGSVYTQPVSSEVIRESKSGGWNITVTTEKPVPRSWFPPSLEGLKILCLAAGGGQQGPILAAAGADVTVFDLSKNQLEQDEKVAEREGLTLTTILGDMTDLSCLDKESFDMVIHPVSNLFVQDINLVWKEVFKIMKDNGVLITGFVNPLLWIFDEQQESKGKLIVNHSIPSSTLEHLSKEDAKNHLLTNETIEYAHTLEDQINGQMDAGFVLTNFYEDDFGGTKLIDKYIKTLIATRAIKMKGNEH